MKFDTAFWLWAIATSTLSVRTNAFVVTPPPPPVIVHRGINRQLEETQKSHVQSHQQQQQQPFSNVRPRTPTVLFMGWGPDPIWSTATVTSNTKACLSGASVTLQVRVPPETAAEYTTPGQYVQIRPIHTNTNDDTIKPLFLAIASPPNPENAVMEFLVKKTNGNEWLTSIEANTDIELSQILGNGFAMHENLEGFKYDFPTQNVLLFAAGSGIAPIKAAMESGALDVKKDGARTARLYYGERTANDLCFMDKFAEWEASGFEVVPVLSQPDDAWQGRTGYVQTALEEDGIAIPRNSGALLCGMKGMTEAIKDLLLKAGVFDGRVLFNF